MFVRLAPAALCLLFLAGCGPAKLNESRSYELNPAEGDGFLLDKQSKPQKINIEFTSSESEVTVLLFKAEDVPGEEKPLSVDEQKALGFKKGKADSFSVDVPENTETRLVIRGAMKKTKVDVKVTNK